MNSDLPGHRTQERSFHESAEDVYDLASCGYLTTTPEGKIITVNRTLLQWLGYEMEDLTTGKRLIDLLTVGGRIYFETHFNLLLRVQDSVDEIALDLIRKDGTPTPMLLNGRQKRDANGEPILNRFALFNATERRMYERELLTTRDLLQTTLSSIGDAVVTTDLEGRVTFLNPVAEALSGWNRDDAKGLPIENVVVMVREDSLESIENPVNHALRVGEVVGLTNHTLLISKDGRRIPIDDSASPIWGENDAIVGGVLIFRDVTERRSAQLALTEAEAHARSMIVELQRSNDDLSQFAAVASHDLKSPLNNVVLFAQLIDRRHGDQLGEGKELLNMLIGAAQRMGHLIEDLLRYAATTTAVASSSQEAVDANAQIEIAIQNLQLAITHSGAIVTHDVLPKVTLDETHLCQLFQNLIGNSIHYRGSDPPRIHVGVDEKQANWIFSCADNGVGIAPEHQAQIFEPFKRLHGSDRPGSGIGLAICKRIVERSNGQLWVESQVGHGSTFFFSLPKLSHFNS